jgi:hypothetical protein
MHLNKSASYLEGDQLNFFLDFEGIGTFSGD